MCNFVYIGDYYTEKFGLCKELLLCYRCRRNINAFGQCMCDWDISDALNYLQRHKPEQYIRYRQSTNPWSVVGSKGKHSV